MGSVRTKVPILSCGICDPKGVCVLGEDAGILKLKLPRTVGLKSGSHLHGEEWPFAIK